MDLSVQKMQPPASVQGKSAAKKTSPGSSDDAVDDVSRDQKTRFAHGNTGYDEIDADDCHPRQPETHERKRRRKNRQLLSREDLSELTSSLEELQQADQSADGLMNMRAYQAQPSETEEDERPHFEVNI
ncbi:hypothetical protein [Cohaesibacter celericrescens]|uniref:Uncharacterized protein n=1 Tax=Cohaesibacter celericrescens TaxID=2067669 RepID=A0A2N5XWG4_9HYPH|nr:hypothetical protein [Cohaesibacter celericrescens]PLW78851.1 hypothetical protein C0081_01000 [Cohaesibacter celericrescens]